VQAIDVKGKNKKEEVIKRRNDWIHNFYPSPNMIIPLKSRRIRWLGHTGYLGDREFIYFMSEILNRRYPKRQGIDGWILIKLIIKKWDIG
jgi:hypothetical protein